MKFTKEELAKYLMCWDFREPYISNREHKKFCTVYALRKWKKI